MKMRQKIKMKLRIQMKMKTFYNNSLNKSKIL